MQSCGRLTQQHQNFLENCESNPGPSGLKHEHYPCATWPPSLPSVIADREIIFPAVEQQTWADSTFRQMTSFHLMMTSEVIIAQNCSIDNLVDDADADADVRVRFSVSARNSGQCDRKKEKF